MAGRLVAGAHRPAPARYCGRLADVSERKHSLFVPAFCAHFRCLARPQTSRATCNVGASTPTWLRKTAVVAG
eukprot:7937865-Lingulodinium_polyedra.AAC.2